MILDCPIGWRLIAGNCYLFSTDHLKLHEAQRSCIAMESRLFEPRNIETNKLVFDIAKNVSEGWKSRSNKYIFFWIGIHDSRNEGTFSYLSDNNSPILWDNFGPNEPNNHNNKEDCVYAHANGIWNDVDCNTQTEFICEIELSTLSKFFLNVSMKNI